MKMVIRGNMATAVGAKLCKPNVIPAYPITPSTLFPEKMSEFVADGELDAEFVMVESEHSAMSAAIGASAAGARVTTATASQGLALMHEMLFIAAGLRLPIVMAIGNRALAAPINIWCDHQDTISERDTGWLQFYAETNQEALDLMILGFKVGEDNRVLLPVMVGLDAFVLTHTMEAVDAPEQEDVDKFVGVYNPTHVALDPKNPMTLGSFGTPEFYMEYKLAQELAIQAARDVVDEAFAGFKEMTGRGYSKVVPFMCDDADVIIMSMGSMTGTARQAVKKMREEGKKVGLLKLTVYRPFPFAEILEVTRNARALAIAERDISPGFGGAVYSEVAGLFVNMDKKPMILDYIVGLGGRDVVPDDFETIVDKSEKALADGGPAHMTEWINITWDNMPEGVEEKNTGSGWKKEVPK